MNYLLGGLIIVAIIAIIYVIKNKSVEVAVEADINKAKEAVVANVEKVKTEFKNAAGEVVDVKDRLSKTVEDTYKKEVAEVKTDVVADINKI